MADEKRQRRGIIYLIHCILENKDYVGQTRRSLKKRWAEHRRAVSNYVGKECHGKPIAIQLIDWKIDELGEDAFEIKILERPLLEDLNDREAYWISQMKSKVPCGYNQTSGGGSRLCVGLSDEECQIIASLYEDGKSSVEIAKMFDCSSQHIIAILRNCDVKIRTHEENVEALRENTYYRLSKDGKTILEKYKSFALIGKWAQNAGLTKIANASTAGMRTRYAMLFGTEAYGFKWDASWSDEEKEERRKAFRKSSESSHSNENPKSVEIPSRGKLKGQLQAMPRKDILKLYDVSPGCLDNWRQFYCLGPNGEDLEGWKEAPSQYTKSLKNDKVPIPKPSYEELLASLKINTIQAAAKSFGVNAHTYKKWLREEHLPATRTDIDAFIQARS